MSIIFALLAGCLIAFQGATNAQLSKHLGHSIQAAAISFVIGTLALLLATFILKAGLPDWTMLSKVPTKLFAGGIFGAIFVAANILLIPKIGSANMLMAALAGQMIVSLSLDHFALLGLQARPLTLSRGIGALCILFGVFLISQSKVSPLTSDKQEKSVSLPKKAPIEVKN